MVRSRVAAPFRFANAQVEAANKARMDVIMFEALRLPRSSGAVAGVRPMRHSRSFASRRSAVHVDEDKQELPKLPTQ
jgi:hypothetical protein